MATKFKGRNLSFTVDGEEFNADGTSVVMDSEDADTDALTFEEYSEQGDGTPQQWFFTISLLQNFAAASFWTALWENAGENVAFVFRPHGNVTPAADQPHFTGTCTIPRKPPAGGAAGETWTVDSFRLNIDGEPARVIV